MPAGLRASVAAVALSVTRIVAAGFARIHKSDTLEEILGATDRAELLDWLRANDVASSATPEQVQEIFPATVAVGAQFGVVMVISAFEWWGTGVPSYSTGRGVSMGGNGFGNGIGNGFKEET